MERFVFIAAVTIAILFGIGAVFGGPNFHWGDVDFDGGGTAPVVETTAGRLEAQAYQGENLSLKHLVAIVTITPEDRADYSVEIDSPGGTPMPTVSAADGRVTVDGQLRGRISRCNEDGSANLRGYDEITAANLPRINIRAPRTLNISRSGAGRTEIGPSEALTLDLSGCGAVTAGDVAGDMMLDMSGSGGVRAGAARNLNADVSGSGSVAVGAIAQGADIDVSGSGSVTAGAVADDADIDVSGSGSVTLASLSGQLSADGSGSGSVQVQGGAITVADVELSGSGDVDIAASVQTLRVSISGSSDVEIRNTVGDIEAEIAGSGDVAAQSVTGSVREESWGSGDVLIGGQPRGGRTR